MLFMCAESLLHCIKVPILCLSQVKIATFTLTDIEYVIGLR